MAGRTQGPIPSKPPTKRKITVRSVVITVDGRERPYPVYRFSRQAFYERPTHNPFEGL